MELNPTLVKRTMHMFRDPMSKTLVACICGIVSLTILGMTVIVGAIIKGNIGDGAIIGLVSTIVTGIGGCVMGVASRAQNDKPTASHTVTHATTPIAAPIINDP